MVGLAERAERGSARFTANNGPAAVLLALALLFGALAGWGVWRHSIEVERNTAFTIGLERMLSAMKDLENGQRGFLLTGNDSYLDVYRAASPSLDRHLQAIQALDLPTGDLAALAAERRQLLERGIDVYRHEGAAAAVALVQRGHGKELMDSLRLRVQAEEGSADERMAYSRRRETITAVPLTMAALACLGSAFGLLIRATVRRRRAQQSSEKRLRESEARFRTLTEAVSSMVWVTDGDGRFVAPQSEWAAFTGDGFDVHREWGWLAAVHPDDVEATEAAWKTAVATSKPYRIEHRLRRRDGVWRYVDATAVPIPDGDGRVREWVGSHADITDRKEAEHELAAAKTAAESANRAKSVFLANMSHELRTPLSAVIGYSEMMEEEVEDLGIDSLSADLGKIKSNARHLLSLINDVLDLSKIEANRMDVFAEDLDVEPLLRDVAATVESLVAKKGNSLDCVPSGELGTMRTDAVKLRQCLFNLVSNAAKFTEGGRIALIAERLARADGDWLEFRVRDTGIGMSAEQVDRLFQRFSQADETTTRKFGGTGLGLAITRAFCLLLGGDIRVESVLGQGSTFIMTLPVRLPDASQGPQAGEAEASASHPRERELVLVIDDDAAQRDLMARFLERQGFATRTAPDGSAGIELARSLKPRAILLDVMMPQMDGWSVLTTLKADPDLARIPVVMVTFVHDTGMGAALGAADYLTKPVHWDKLRLIMDRFRSAEGDVLIVDDDADARTRLATMLDRNGWTTREAADGREALDIVARAVPRVILLDLTMPVMDGFGFLEELRERPGCVDVPVIVLTARDLSADDRRRLEGADRVFSKGDVTMSEITREIRAVAPPASEPERAEEPST